MKIFRLFKFNFGTRFIIKLIIILTILLIYFNYEQKFIFVLSPLANKSTTIGIINRTSNLKYLLLWTNANEVPFIFLGKGRSVFIERNCKWNNCFITDDRNYLEHYSEFDAIAFNGPSISRTIYYPIRRRQHQKFIFASIESSYNYPVCSKMFNNYFNWTWTYKLNSDAYWSYMIIRDATGKVIGPSTNIHWLDFEEMKPIENSLIKQLSTKRKAAVWFVSSCFTSSNRNSIAKSINLHLKQYNLSVDIFGKCGNLKCPTNEMEHCLRMVERDYYFYLAFENSFSEDYVTEKILNALRHNTVPIVYGGANYTRYMADYMYLNANEINPEQIANLMYKIISNPKQYYNFFRWKKYYSYHFKWESPETDDYCNFCKMLNNEELTSKLTIYKSFTKWWNTKSNCN